jgi:hypothetical protein
VIRVFPIENGVSNGLSEKKTFITQQNSFESFNTKQKPLIKMEYLPFGNTTMAEEMRRSSRK